MATVTSNLNVFNPSSLVSKTLMGMLEAKTTLLKFVNMTYNEIFTAGNKEYAAGNTYTIMLPTWPIVQWGAAVTPTGKQTRQVTINIDTSNGVVGGVFAQYKSGYFNACRQLDSISEQLYIQSEDEWKRQFVKPIFDILVAHLEQFLATQLQRSTCYTAMPLTLGDRGANNEACGRFKTMDIGAFNTARNFMAQIGMHNPEEFVFVMNTYVFMDLVNILSGTTSVTSGVTFAGTRYLPKTLEKLVETLELSKVHGVYIYHSPFIPRSMSGTANAFGSIAAPDPSGNNGITYSNNTVTNTGLDTLSYCGYTNQYSGTNAPVSPSNVVMSGLNPTPETAGYLLIAYMTGLASSASWKLSFNPGDTLVLSPFDNRGTSGGSGTAMFLNMVDPIAKTPRYMPFTCNVTSYTPITFSLSAAGTGISAYVPVNALPYGPEIQSGNTMSATSGNELQAISRAGYSVGTQIYVMNTGGSSIPFMRLTTDGAAGIGCASLRQLGNRDNIYGFSKYGLNFVNPKLAEIKGAENSRAHSEDQRLNILTTMQGSVSSGLNILRVSSLWGAGGVYDNIIQIPYYAGY